MTIELGITLFLLGVATGYAWCALRECVQAAGPDPEPEELPSAPVNRAARPVSRREMTPRLNAKMRHLMPQFAKAEDDVLKSDENAEKIRAALLGGAPQAGMPETMAKGNVRTLPSPARKL